MTASLPQAPHQYTFADYLTLERESETKHEFYAGEILAMSGGTARHSALAARMIVAMGNTAASGTVFTSDMRVRVAATGRATYPDISMVCGPIEYDADDAVHTTVTNPLLLVEILSPTTEKDDRGDKWMHYQQIASLQEYVLVSQEPRIEIFRRTPSNTWGTSRCARGTCVSRPGRRSMSRRFTPIFRPIFRSRQRSPV
ncbi:MAG TPA: Uma2 family endonuclease [Thermoanaerobaculia bacterium]|jgi:Uma2 family endonuclease